MADDILDLILYILRKQDKIETRDDTTIAVLLKPAAETITIQETSTILTKNAHPVHYDDAEAIYGGCTYA